MLITWFVVVLITVRTLRAIPYLGFYLTDLAFIEDGTPNSDENGLINFSKMRMVRSCFLEHLAYLILTAERWVSLQIVSFESLKLSYMFFAFFCGNLSAGYNLVLIPF